MKIFCAVLLVAAASVAAEEKYTKKYDNVNVDEILKNDRLLNNYINCILDKGKCSPDGQELKSHIKEALETECAKCTEKQKEGAKHVLEHLYKNKQEVFKALEKKYDAGGKYRDMYEQEAKKRGINL